MNDQTQSHPVRVRHSKAGNVALGSCSLAWLIFPVLYYLHTRFNEESANGTPHAVPDSVIMAVGGSVSILMLVGLILGVVGLLQRNRRRANAIVALAMFLAWIGLMWVLSGGFTR